MEKYSIKIKEIGCKNCSHNEVCKFIVERIPDKIVDKTRMALEQNVTDENNKTPQFQLTLKCENYEKTIFKRGTANEIGVSSSTPLASEA